MKLLCWATADGTVSALGTVYAPGFAAFAVCAMVHLRTLCQCRYKQAGGGSTLGTSG